MVQQRVLDTADGRFMFRVNSAAREFLLQKGTDLKYGARHLKRAIERRVVYPLARLLATDQMNVGDVLVTDRHFGDKGLIFLRDTERLSSLSGMWLAIPDSRHTSNAEVTV